jgi:hypothetical protein
MNPYNNTGRIDMYDNIENDDNNRPRRTRAQKAWFWLWAGVSGTVLVLLALYGLLVAALSSCGDMGCFG